MKGPNYTTSRVKKQSIAVKTAGNILQLTHMRNKVGYHPTSKSKYKLENRRRDFLDKIAASKFLFSYKNHSLSIKSSLRAFKLKAFWKPYQARTHTGRHKYVAHTHTHTHAVYAHMRGQPTIHGMVLKFYS